MPRTDAMTSDSRLHAAEERIGNDATRTNGSDPETFREHTVEQTRELPEPASGIRPDLARERGTGSDAGGVGKSL